MTGPRLGFVGLGWIGGLRLEAVAEAGTAQIAALCDPSPERLKTARRQHPRAAAFDEYDRLLDRAAELGLDGVVLATPNSLHAPQAAAALERGLSVFCQKPLARTADEARQILAAARRADRLLAVDYSYRFTRGAQLLRQLTATGVMGEIRFVESVFHNGYGPDKAWCFEPEQGGGALLDLGVHQIDLALWLLGYPAVEEVTGHALAAGQGGAAGHALAAGQGPAVLAVDDFAVAQLRLAGGTLVHIAVSWNAHVGRDCVIRTALYGAVGGAEIRNVGGSFYDFEVVRHAARASEQLGQESRAWMGRGILDWVERLGAGRAYDAEAEASLVVAEIVDAIYGRVPFVRAASAPPRQESKSRARPPVPSAPA